MATIGEKLRAARKSRGLTQKQLAQLAGTSQEMISRWEGSYQLPSVTKLVALLDQLDYDINFTDRKVSGVATGSTSSAVRKLLRDRARPSGSEPPSWPSR